MILTLNKWTSHHNQILYSLLYFAERHNVKLKIVVSNDVPNNAVVLNYNNKKALLDYSDDVKFLESPHQYDFYFKRSLLLKDFKNGIHPLNFQVNFSYKTFKLISKLPLDLLRKSNSRTEFIRALDCFNLLTNDSHQSKKINTIWTDRTADFGGRIIFMTRLWDPSRNNNVEEKRRREIQNNFE